jgi:hypothetical protein
MIPIDVGEFITLLLVWGFVCYVIGRWQGRG